MASNLTLLYLTRETFEKHSHEICLVMIQIHLINQV
jgi:hypothetical protein